MEWHVAVSDKQYTAESLQQIATWISERRIPWDALVYHPSYGRWVPARDVAELRHMAASQSVQTATPSSGRGVAVTLGCGLGLLAIGLLAIVLVVRTGSNISPATDTTSQPTSVVAPSTAGSTSSAPTAFLSPSTSSGSSENPRASSDYQTGHARGQTEGADHARSGAGMPIPLGMNWMADLQAEAVHPANVEQFKLGFKEGFEAGFKSVKNFDRDPRQWEQLAWSNAKADVRLYDYDGTHEATIVNVDPRAGIIVVRYRSGEVEPKDLAAVAPYWWVRRK